jgi:hypothetical protein
MLAEWTVTTAVGCYEVTTIRKEEPGPTAEGICGLSCWDCNGPRDLSSWQRDDDHDDDDDDDIELGTLQ